jgi:nitrate/nitrite transporter NarK
VPATPAPDAHNVPGGLSAGRHYLGLLALIIAGEVIFSLPFHIPRFFRPTMLEVFDLSNTQLGDIFALYGVVAMLAYFPGGTLADRFPARKLMAFSLLATALGGFYLYTLPGRTGLYILFAYWGLTSILLFWAAMIKATREWGGSHEQGLAFGMLDGGRGLVASLLASLAVLILAQRLVGTADNQAGLQSVILFYSVATVLAAVIVWFALPKAQDKAAATRGNELTAERPHWRQVLRESSVWLQAGVVVCAYCGYKSLDNYGVYAVEVLNMNQLQAAELTTYASYSRPVAAIAAGLWADRWRSSGVITVLFALGAIAFFLMRGFAGVLPGSLIITNVVITFVAVYALRGIYFSLIEEAKLDARITGSAVGLISVLGFTPDIFFAALTGRLLDANPGAVGFGHYFLMMALISALGMVCTVVLARRLGRGK